MALKGCTLQLHAHHHYPESCVTPTRFSLLQDQTARLSFLSCMASMIDSQSPPLPVVGMLPQIPALSPGV